MIFSSCCAILNSTTPRFHAPGKPPGSIPWPNMAFSFKRQLIQIEKFLPSKGQQKIYGFSLIVLIIIRTETLGFEPLARWGLIFDDFQADTRLNGNHLRILFNTHRKGCALMCTLHPKCISINFCGRSTCQLNSEDKYFLNATLIKATGCSYYGMRLDQAPFCEEEGVSKLITNDRNPGYLENWGKFDSLKIIRVLISVFYKNFSAFSNFKIEFWSIQNLGHLDSWDASTQCQKKTTNDWFSRNLAIYFETCKLNVLERKTVVKSVTREFRNRISRKTFTNVCLSVVHFFRSLFFLIFSNLIWAKLCNFHSEISTKNHKSSWLTSEIRNFWNCFDILFNDLTFFTFLELKIFYAWLFWWSNSCRHWKKFSVSVLLSIKNWQQVVWNDYFGNAINLSIFLSHIPVQVHVASIKKDMTLSGASLKNMYKQILEASGKK